MNILFIHRHFPGQFRYVAPLLVKRYGWQCTFLTADRRVPSPAEVAKINYAPSEAGTANGRPIGAWTESVSHAAGVYNAVKARPDLRPDLIVSHGSYGSTLFLTMLSDAPIINFFEYFYRPVGQELGYRPDEPVTENHLFLSRTRNAMTLLDLDNCDQGWTPTGHQRGLMPREYHGKIEAIHDGIDTNAFRPMPGAPRVLPDGTAIPEGTRVVTYASRGFEKLRGFDVFLRVAKRIYQRFPDVVFVVAGSDRIFYGNEDQRGPYASFRERVLAEGDYDLSKFRFVGKLPQAALARLLAFSDLHVYLTVPFFTSWSPLEAMSAGCVLLGSDTACVREYLTHERNGLLCDFFDEEKMAEQAVRVLKDPAAHRPLGESARRTIEETYSIDVTLPRIKAMFERVASKRREPSVRMDALATAPDVEPVAPLPPPVLTASAVASAAPEVAPYDGSIPFGKLPRNAPCNAAPLEDSTMPCAKDVRSLGVPRDDARGLRVSDDAQAPRASADAAPKRADRNAREEPRTVMFCWELGGGLGHLMQMLPLARGLARRGHTVYVAMRHLDRAWHVFGRTGILILQAPYKTSGSARYPRPRNYAEMLANVGFASEGGLFVRGSAWRTMVEMIEPHLLVFDHAPTALLATRGMPCRRALLGSGFCCPPDAPGDAAGDSSRWAPFPVIQQDATDDLPPANHVLPRMNRVLARWGAPPLERLGQLYTDVDENFLTTFPELDHFPSRAGAAYWGPTVGIAPDGAARAEWPAGEGPRVLVYLKCSPETEHVLAALRDLRWPTVAYLDDASESLRRRLASATVRIADAPLDLTIAAEDCDVAILNGGHGVTAEMLLAGKPVLQIPLALEQQMTADAAARLGAGASCAAKSAGEVRSSLETLLADGCADAARRFAARYESFDPGRQRRTMVDRVEELLHAPALA